MICGTWNVQGITNKIKEVISVLSKLRGDIQMIEDYILTWSGVNKSTRAQAGVTVLLKRSLANNIKDIFYINERILRISIQIKGQDLEIIADYAPTNDSIDRIKDKFYEDLNIILENINQSQEMIIMGYLNARIGSRDDDDVVGKFGEEVVNNNGERLIEFCKQHKLRIYNSFFQHKEIHKFTWERPSINQKSIIDYIISKQDTPLTIQDVRVKRGFDCGSDHYLVIGKVLLPCFRTSKSSDYDIQNNQEAERWPKYKLHLLHQDSIRLLYQNRLKERLDIINETNDVELFHQEIHKAISTAAAEALGEEIQKENNCIGWNSEMELAVKAKKNAYLKWLNDRNAGNLQEYRRTNNERRKKC